MIETTTLWSVILLLGLGSFLLRFSFLGIVGNRPLPAWMLRWLRYTAVAILPAMVAPIVALSNASGTGPDPSRLVAAIVTLGVGAWRQSLFAGLLSGAFVLGFGTYFFG